MANDLQTIPFHGDEILTFEHDGVPVVAMRRIVENMGMSWSTQQSKLLADISKFNCVHTNTVGADGKSREMLCMPVARLPAWLYSINAKKVPDPAVAARVRLYQDESSDALFAYWTKGVAVRPSATPALPAGPVEAIVVNLDDAAMMQLGMMVKGIVRKQLREMLAPDMIEAEMSRDPRRAVGEFVSVRDILQRARAAQKGRRGLGQKVSADMRARSDVSERKRCPHTSSWLFAVDFAHRYMAERGAGLVKAHNDAVNGQGSLRLISGGRRASAAR